MKTSAKKSLAIPATRGYLSKEVCREKAEEIIAEKKISDMTASEIAREIYFHACIFYAACFLKKYHLPVQWFINRADPIDLEDGGDTSFRRILYRIMWLFPGKKKH